MDSNWFYNEKQNYTWALTHVCVAICEEENSKQGNKYETVAGRKEVRQDGGA